MRVGEAGNGRRITHVECIHRPAERVLAIELFEVLGCRVVDRGGTFFTAFVEPDESNFSANVFYASEVTPEQWEFELELQRAAPDPIERFASQRRDVPQRSFHFGFRVPDEAGLDAIVKRVQQVGECAGNLGGRVAVDGVFRPGDPGAIAPNMTQVFVWTDVVACGLLALGQHFEVQWHHDA